MCIFVAPFKQESGYEVRYCSALSKARLPGRPTAVVPKIENHISKGFDRSSYDNCKRIKSCGCSEGSFAFNPWILTNASRRHSIERQNQARLIPIALIKIIVFKFSSLNKVQHISFSISATMGHKSKVMVLLKTLFSLKPPMAFAGDWCFNSAAGGGSHQ